LDWCNGLDTIRNFIVSPSGQRHLKPLPNGTLYHAFLVEDFEDSSCLRYDANRFLPCCTDKDALDSVSTLRTQRIDSKLCVWIIDVKEGTLGTGTNVVAGANYEKEKEILLQQQLSFSCMEIKKGDKCTVVSIKAENEETKRSSEQCCVCTGK